MGSKVSPRPPVPPSVIPDQHQGSKSDFGGEVDIEEAIDKSGCSSVYYLLEDCLGEHDRDWRRCQEQVRTRCTSHCGFLWWFCMQQEITSGTYVIRMCGHASS